MTIRSSLLDRDDKSEVICEKGGDGPCSHCETHGEPCVRCSQRERRRPGPDDSQSDDDARPSIIVHGPRNDQAQVSNRPGPSANKDVRHANTELARDDTVRALKYFCTYLSPMIPIVDFKTREMMWTNPREAMNELGPTLTSAICVAVGPYLSFSHQRTEELYDGTLNDISAKLHGNAEPQLSLLRAIQVLMAFAKNKRACLPYLLYRARERMPNNLDERAKSINFVLTFAGCMLYSIPVGMPLPLSLENIWAKQARASLPQMEQLQNGDDIWLCSLVSACLSQKEFFNAEENSVENWSENLANKKLRHSLNLLAVQFFPDSEYRSILKEFLVNLIQASFRHSRICTVGVTEETQSTELCNKYIQLRKKHTLATFDCILELVEKQEWRKDWLKVSHLNDILMLILPSWLLGSIFLRQKPEQRTIDAVLEYMRLAKLQNLP